MLKEKSFDTGVVEINYAEGPPSGPPLILLPGFPARWQSFLPIIPALSMRWHIYALDYRGQGKSGRVPGKYRPEDYSAGFAGSSGSLGASAPPWRSTTNYH